MRCSTVRSLLDDHLDGVLPAERSNEIREHLDSCAECDGEAELARCVAGPISGPLSAWGDLEPPPGCFDRILSRIEALPAEAHVPAPPRPALDRPALARPALVSEGEAGRGGESFAALQRLRGGARWFMTSGAAAAAVLLAATAIERTGDLEDPGRTRDRVVRVQPAFASLQLKPGEIPLTRSRLHVTDDMEQNDGLRRIPGPGSVNSGRGSRRIFPAGPAAEFAVPVSSDLLGGSPR